MQKLSLKWVLALAVMVLALVLGACASSASPSPTSPSGPGSQAPTNGLVQSSSGGSVTIDVKWLGAQDGSLAFQVTMDTHSVDLDQYDLGKLAVLRDDTGKEYAPAAWLSPPGGHHREGTLKFPVPESLTQGKARSIQLVIRDVAGVGERVLQWLLG